MNPPHDKKEPVEIEAKWADKSQEARVTSNLGDHLTGKFILVAAMLAFLLFLLYFDPILSRKF